MKVKVVRIVDQLFTNIASLFAELCAADDFRKTATDKINFFRRRFATQGKTDERISQILFSNRQNDV